MCNIPIRLISIFGLVTGTASVPSLAADTCRSFEATLLLNMAPDGCTSPVKICTKGTIVSSDPSLTGATWYYTMLGNVPSVGLSESMEPGSTLAYAGRVAVTTQRDGTFLTKNVGVFDSAIGAFSQLDRVVEGTQRFTGAKGNIFVSGIGNPDAGFNSNIHGEICLKQQT